MIHQWKNFNQHVTDLRFQSALTHSFLQRASLIKKRHEMKKIEPWILLILKGSDALSGINDPF